jgi:hypothetical protein
MAEERLKKDANYVSVIGAVTNDGSQDITQVRVNPLTRRLLVEPSALNGATDSVSLHNEGGELINPATEDGNLANIPGLSIPIHDYIGLTYTGSNLTTVVYKTGGASGTTVATLTLTYDGSDNLITVTKT